MSEWIIETRYLDPERSSQITVGHAPGRVRSASEVYSFDTSVLDCDNQDSRKNSDDGRLINFLSPTDSSRSIIGNQGEQTPNDNEITSGRFVVGSLHNSHSHLTTETRGRLFSELSLSDLPSEGNENPISLDISFPCSYEENMELRCKTIVQLRKASIKRVVVCAGTRIARYNIVYTKDRFYWPQETIRHCRTGRIKRGMILKRQFGVYYPDKNKDLIALKIMEKNAISESLQWNEDDVHMELGVMKELCEGESHENILYLHDSLETKDYLIAVMELVDGDLHDMLASIRSHETAISVFKQVIRGYSYLVEKGYFHCDLSLENIAIKLVPNFNNSGKAKLIAKLSDFGRVRKIDDDGHAFIEDDEIAGKPYYLAPEAYLGSYDAGPADIWSLGIILYILVVGHSPFSIANDSDEVFEPFSEYGFDYLLPVLSQANVNEQIIDLLKSILRIKPDERMTITALSERVLSL